MGFQQVIDGVTLNGTLVAMAQEAVGKRSDGKIALDDAVRLYECIIDDGIYTQVEEDSVQFLLEKFLWSTDGRQWFLRELSQWQIRGLRSIPMTVEAVGKEHFPKDDILLEQFDRITRETELRAATMETYDDHEEIALIVHLADGRRVRVKSNFIELEGDYVELRGGVAIPLRAIERVEI